MKIDKNELHAFFDSMNDLMKDGDFYKVRNEVESYFNNIRVFLEFNDFEEILETTKYNKNQKEIIKDYYLNGKDISDLLAFKIAAFPINNLDDKNKTNEFIKLFEDQIFTKDFYNKINSNIDDFDIKNNLVDSILFIRNNILPNSKAEVAAKFYIYIVSGNLQHDLINDINLRSSINQSNYDYDLLKKIAKSMEYWKINHDKSNEVNVTIKTEYPNYSHFGFNNGMSDGGIHHIITHNTPPGYFDVVMKSPDKKNIYIARVNNNTAESDIYNHLSRRLVEEAAITAMNLNNIDNIILFDFCKGHSEKLIKQFTGDYIDKEKVEELKKIFDIILHKAVSEITGFDPIIIQLGDTKYNIEQDEFLDLSIKMTDFMMNRNLNFDNKFIMDILQKTTEWMTINLMKNIDFYSEDNLLKCKQYLKNINIIINQNSIIKTSLEKEIDHLESKLNNHVKSKTKLELDIERERILRRLNYLESNDILSFFSKDDIQEFTRLRNIFLDNLNHLSYVLQDDESSHDGRTMKELKYLVNARNSQYYLFEKLLVIESMNRDKAPKSTLEKIRKNDPLLVLLYDMKDTFNKFQNNCSVESAKEYRDNLIKFNEFADEKGDIYKFFYQRNKYITKDAFEQTGNFFKTDCNFEGDVKLLDVYISKMESKDKILRSVLKSEKDMLHTQLSNIIDIKNKILNNEPFDEDKIPKQKKIIRFKNS